jgi:D-3-phosphoglycerate dehydrogenase
MGIRLSRKSKVVLSPALVPSTDVWAEKPSQSFLKTLVDELAMYAEVKLALPSSKDWHTLITEANILGGPPRVDLELLEIARNLEMVQCFGIGYDHIDVKECTKKGIIVCNVAEIYSEPVAQHAWGLILDLSKHITRADKAMRDSSWERKNWMGVQIWGKTLGVIGLGGIGGRVALKGRLAFGMKILAYDPYVLPAKAQLYGAELVSLEALLKESDVIVVCAPLTPETYHLIGEKQFNIMKSSALFINVSRGGIVDTNALIKALENKRIAGAGLDVTEPEPLESDSPLLKMENVVLTPHIASSTSEAVEETFKEAVKNMIRYLKGERPYWIINPEAYNIRCKTS